MGKQKEQPRSWVVRFTRTQGGCEAIVDAESEAEARVRFDAGHWRDVTEGETQDWKIEDIEPNE